MKKNLSSDWTFTYKFVIPSLWALVITLATIFIFLDSGDFRTFFLLLAILPGLISMRIQKVAFDDNSIIVSNWRTERVYDLSKVKSMNGGGFSPFDPWFELEIFGSRDEIEKIDFMPRVHEQLRYIFTKRYSGRLLEFQNKIRTVRQAT
jgi:hypothetical protein